MPRPTRTRSPVDPKAKVDARHRTLVALDGREGHASAVGLVGGRRVGRRRGHHELELPPPETQLHRPRGKLAGDLLGGDGQRVLQREPDRRIEWSGEALGDGPGFLAPRLGGHGQLALELVDVQCEIHGSILAS